MRYINLIKNIKNWWLYLQYKFFLVQTESLFFKTRKGIFFEVPRRLLHEFKEIFMEECYMHAPEIKISESPVFIDIGANAGYFSLYAASRFPRATILAYEPIPSNFRLLKRNTELNKNTKIAVFQKAIAVSTGTIKMTFDNSETFSTSAHIVNENNPIRQSDFIEVECLTLKDIFDNNKLNYCDFLKMDCEGAEYEIIFNCPTGYLSRIKQFAIEVHGDSATLKQHFNDNGFSTYETKKALGLLYAWKA